MVNGCALMSFLCTKHPVYQTSIKWIYHHASYTSRSTSRYMEISMHIPSMFFPPTCQARVVRFYDFTPPPPPPPDLSCKL